jgi:hypothetical protein
MAEQRHQEFSGLSARAEGILKGPEVDLPHHKSLLRLWHYPSFDRYVSWLVYGALPRYQKSDSPLVCEVVWDRPFDFQRFSDPLKGLKHGFSPEPTITLKQAEVPPDELELRLTNLREIALPVFIDDGSIGLDGESFGVETFGFKSTVRLMWWSDNYERWNSIVDWFEDMRQFLSMCLER